MYLMVDPVFSCVWFANGKASNVQSWQTPQFNEMEGQTVVKASDTVADAPTQQELCLLPVHSSQVGPGAGRAFSVWSSTL